MTGMQQEEGILGSFASQRSLHTPLPKPSSKTRCLTSGLIVPIYGPNRNFWDLESVIQYIWYPFEFFISLIFMSVLSYLFIGKTLERTKQGCTCGIALKFIYTQTLRIFV